MEDRVKVERLEQIMFEKILDSTGPSKWERDLIEELSKQEYLSARQDKQLEKIYNKYCE